jgi:cell division protein FtsL
MSENRKILPIYSLVIVKIMARFFSQGDLGGRRGKKRRAIDQELRVGPVSVRFITIALVTVLSIIYLAQSNTAATKGYQLKELQKEQQELALENERLEVESSRLRSLDRIKDTAQEKKMVPVDKVKYP